VLWRPRSLPPSLDRRSSLGAASCMPGSLMHHAQQRTATCSAGSHSPVGHSRWAAEDALSALLGWPGRVAAFQTSIARGSLPAPALGLAPLVSSPLQPSLVPTNRCRCRCCCRCRCRCPCRCPCRSCRPSCHLPTYSYLLEPTPSPVPPLSLSSLDRRPRSLLLESLFLHPLSFLGFHLYLPPSTFTHTHTHTHTSPTHHPHITPSPLMSTRLSPPTPH
jgi:hypothetical protein